MGWVITGIIFFLIELYVITHTYRSDWGVIRRDARAYRDYYGIIECSEEKLPLTIGRLLVLIIANVIPILSIVYFVFFIVWWIKRASKPVDYNEECIIWRYKPGKLSCLLFTKLSNLLNKKI